MSLEKIKLVKEPNLFLQIQKILESPNCCLFNHAWVEVEQNSLEKKKKTGWGGEESPRKKVPDVEKVEEKMYYWRKQWWGRTKAQNDEKEENLKLGPKDIETNIENEERTNTEVERDLENNKERGEIKSNDKDCEVKEIVVGINKEQNGCGVGNEICNVENLQNINEKIVITPQKIPLCKLRNISFVFIGNIVWPSESPKKKHNKIVRRQKERLPHAAT